MTLRPLIGIVGSGGAYGRWLRIFFQTRMGLEVIGHDPVDAASQTPEELLERADVLLFSAPIRHTPALIERYARRSAGREKGRDPYGESCCKRRVAKVDGGNGIGIGAEAEEC